MKTTDSDQPNQDAMGELRETVESVISNPDRWTDWPDGAVDRIAKAAEAYAQRRVEEKLKEYQDYLLDDADGMIPNAYIRRAYAYFVRDRLNQTTEDET